MNAVGLGIDYLHPRVWALLEADTGPGSIEALAPGGVVDLADPNSEVDFVDIGEFTVIPDDALDHDGRELTLTLVPWSQGTSRVNGRRIQGRMVRLLHDQESAFTPGDGWRVESIELEFAESLRRADTQDNRIWSLHPTRFRFKIHEFA